MKEYRVIELYPGAPPDEWETQLNRNAQAGWEVVATVLASHGRPRAILQREVRGIRQS